MGTMGLANSGDERGDESQRTSLEYLTPSVGPGTIFL